MQTCICNLKMLVHLVVAMGINANFDCWANIHHFDVNARPRLSRNQREQAIGRLGAGESAQIGANAYNVCLQHRYYTTNGTNDCPRSGRPRVTTPRQDRFILRQHLQDRFTTTTETARHTTGTQQRPISADTVCRRLACNNIHCRRPARGSIFTNCHRQEQLQWITARQHWHNQQW